MIEQEKSNAVAFWIAQIEQYERDSATWYKRANKIIKRYKDERPDGQTQANKINILWSNVQTLAPALYDKNPVPNVDRRFQTDDKLGTTAAQVLERCVSFYVDNDLFGKVMRQVVLDRLLPGRGQAWVRYEPKFKEVIDGSKDVQEDGAQVTDDQDEDYKEPEQELEVEDVVVDYVHFEDFGHTWAKTWQEVRAVWRMVPMSRKQLIARFGEEKGQAVQMDVGKKDSNTPDDYKRAMVYEIWDKEACKVYWINKNTPEVLDERQDPLKLCQFFPCPEPVYATLSNDKLIPTPDYIQYQDQAAELDNLTGRIGLLLQALRVAGVYDASAPALQRLLGENTDNILIPVEQWAVFGDKGGLKGVIDFLPIKEIGEVLIGLYTARDRTKQELYEITGISDIIRGASNPNETLGAQELKGKYAGLRIGAMQGDVARFSRDLVRIKAEIIAEHFSLETIKELSGFKLLTAQEKEQIKAKQAQDKAMAQQSQQPPAPMPDELKVQMELPTWEEVIELLRNNTARKFNITIETDSTIKADQDAEKAARTEFLTAAGSFIAQAEQVQNPALQPLLMEMLKFGIKGFKIGREMETTFDVALREIKAQAEAPKQPEQDPAAAQEAAKAQVEGQRLQIEGAKMQQEGQIKQAEMQQNEQFKGAEIQLKQSELQLKQAELSLKEQELQMKYGLENKKIDADLTKSRIDAKSKVHPDVAMSDPDMHEAAEITPIQGMMNQLSETLTQSLNAIAEMQAQNNMAVVAAIQNPPPRTIVRDANNKIVGVE